MADAATTAAAAAAVADLAPAASPADRLWTELQAQVLLIEKGAQAREGRFVQRILRTFSVLRKRLVGPVLARAVVTFLAADHPRRELLPDLGEPFTPTPQPPVALAAALATAAGPPTATGLLAPVPIAPAAPAAPASLVTSTPEVDAYLGLLCLAHLHDSKQHGKAASLATQLVAQFTAANLRVLDPLIARMCFLQARAHDALGTAAELRPVFLDALRVATLRRDEDCQATLLNEILRNLLAFKLYEQAVKLVSKTTLPENASNNQQARHLYYIGRIKAIQLDYSDSHKSLSAAIRKGPQPPAAPGFQQTVHKLAIIVQLLLGEIPERSTFRMPVLRKPLQPYLHLTQAVRVGDLRLFQETVDKFVDKFRADDTYTLILRLRHNVIKTGVRMISVSYSRIALSDIARKLHLDSAEDAEYIAAKAIRDGVIEAVLDHKQGHMSSKEVLDVYSTTEPLEAFNQRLGYCLNLHNQAVKALRFPSNLHKKQFESVEDRKEREREEKELAKELADGGGDDGGDDMM